MSFRTRILLALLAVGVAPVAILGSMSYAANRRELIESAGAAQGQAAAEIARECEGLVLNALEHLGAAGGYLPFGRLSAREASDALRIPFEQLPWIDVLVLLSSDGTAVAPPVYDARASRGGTSEPIGPRELEAFARSVPLATVLASDVAIGPPYRGPRTGAPRVAVAARVAGAPTRVLAAELSLRRVVARLDEVRAGGGVAFLVDASGAVVAHGAADPSLSDDERRLVARGIAALRPEVTSLRRTGTERWLAAFAPVGTVGWGIVLERPEHTALGAARRARAYTFFWAGAALVLAVGLGLVLARSVSVPVARLSAAARAVTEGRYDEELDFARRDELGALAAAFGHMTREVRRRDEEIRRWNEELAGRVEARTSELRIAQDQVARARRLAAIGSLGAGVAHEINNPMTAVVGLVSVARKHVGPDTEDGRLLGTALEQATRVTRIVEDLRRLAEHQRHDGGVQFPLAAAVQASVEAHAAAAERGGVTLRTLLDEGLPAIQGDPAQIEDLVGQLLRNAIAASPHGGEVRVSVSAVDGGALKLSIADDGRGIPADVRERIFDPFFTSKEPGCGVGLGLTLSSCIVEAHHGKLHLESEEGKGSTFTVVLPAAAAQAHLA